MHRMPRRQKNVSTVDVRRETNEHLSQLAKKYKKSKRQFAMDSLDWLVVKDELLSLHFPKLSKIGETSDGWPIIEDKGVTHRDNHFIVKLKDGKLVCMNETDKQKALSCDHVKFVLALPEVQGLKEVRSDFERILANAKRMGLTPP